MVAPVISISSEVSVKSVGSSFPRVILIGSISVEVPVALEVGAAAFASLARVLELDTHSFSEADPLESSPSPVSVAPMVSPFLCSDDSESDTEIPERHVSPTTSTLEIPTALILPAPTWDSSTMSYSYLTRGGHSHWSTLPYSSWNSSSDHSLSGHTPPDTTDDDSFTPQRFVHPPLARNQQCSEAYLRWRSAPLSTMYPSTTSESSAGDSSFESSARPSHKRCRYPAATVTSSIRSTRALVPSHVDLLPPQDIKADATNVEVAVDRDVEAGIDVGIGMKVDVGIDVEDEVKSSDRGTMEVGVDMDVGIDIPDGMLMPDAVEHLEQVEEGMHDIYDHVIEIPLHRIEDIKTAQRQLEAGQLIAGRERVGFLHRHMALSQEEFRQVRKDHDDSQRRLRRLESFVVRRLGFRP
uniref:Uncharacterized protein n=1 Tax=Tanacetum cinerariifolium TaxID=118510 RepID=A0A6L2J3I5_TANCI|nr:hypothetical protein [Tanacetum cinerariifolium]